MTSTLYSLSALEISLADVKFRIRFLILFLPFTIFIAEVTINRQILRFLLEFKLLDVQFVLLDFSLIFARNHDIYKSIPRNHLTIRS